MSVIRIPESGKNRRDNSEILQKGPKISGLLDLANHDLPVPLALAFGSSEVHEYSRTKSLSEEARAKIEEFVRDVRLAGHWPLFAIRFETKGDDRAARPPDTLLNIGLQSIGPDLERRMRPSMYVPISNAYFERIQPHLCEMLPTLADVASEVQYWVLRMCRALQARGGDLSSPMLIQRMVFGCADGRSGNGICCNLPGPPDERRRFQGVFLPGQVGISPVSGCWGPGQVPLSELNRLHPSAYRRLRQIFDYLEQAFGPNRYLEFTIEGDRLFLLQHLTRQREILVD